MRDDANLPDLPPPPPPAMPVPPPRVAAPRRPAEAEPMPELLREEVLAAFAYNTPLVI